MTETNALREESIELEALLLSRQYLYTLFHKLFGGTPDADVIQAVLSDTTANTVEEFAGENPAMQGLGRFLADLHSCVDPSLLLESARDEYTRLFVGPAALPAPVTESPYLTSDPTDFQENTLAVRRIYRNHGLELVRLMRIPDDHAATMCAFLATLAAESAEALEAGDLPRLQALLRDQEQFVNGHVLTWADQFARGTRKSKTAVLYPQMIEAFAAFATNDAALLSEAALWAETAEAQVAGDAVALGARPGTTEAAAFANLQKAWEALRDTRPYGIEDHELVAVKS